MGEFWLRESSCFESFELNNFAASLYFSAHSLTIPPARVLCDGTHPIGGAPSTAILRAPSLYISYQFIQDGKKII